MRGQTATEFLMLLAFLLLLIAPITYTIFTESSETSRIIDAQLAVDTLADVADLVYYQAPGARQVVTVYVPHGVDWTDSYIGHPTETGGYEINLATQVQTGDTTDVWADTHGEIRGTWPDSSGRYNFIIRKMDEGYVLIGPYELTFVLDPQVYERTMQRGNSTSFTLTATEVGTEARDLTLTATGEIASWITLGTAELELTASGANTTSVQIDVPSDAPYGEYTGEVEATDGLVTDSVFITIIVVSDSVPPGVFEQADLFIVKPENATYHSLPLDLEFVFNDTIYWCGYSIDDAVPLEISGNSTFFTTKGEHKLELFCVGEGGTYGSDVEYFTLNISDIESALHCFSLKPVRAFNSTYDDVLYEVNYSDNVYADVEDIKFGRLSFIQVDWAVVLPGNTQSYLVHNISQTFEHHESSSQMDLALQWLMPNGWGLTACFYGDKRFDTNDTCTITAPDAMENPGRKDELSTKFYYLAHSVSAQDAHMDWNKVEICFGERITKLDIISPLSQNYPTNSVWFNVTSNALLRSANYSLDGAANVSMDLRLINATKLVSVANGSHSVTFYGSDANHTVMQNTTTFSVNVIADLTAPVITIVAPNNATYPVDWVMMNITLNEAGSWAGYSLDGAANVTMGGSGTSWYKNATGLSNAQHYVTFHANDTSGNMGQSTTRWFTVNTSAVSACPFTIDLWALDTDKPQPLTFTSGLNATANTFGETNTSDGWDWGWNVYDTGSSCVYFNGNAYVDASSPTAAAVSSSVNTDNLLRIDIGDTTEVGNSVCNNDGHGSGAYGVGLAVTSEMWSEIQVGGDATLYFDWSFTDYALDTGDAVWVKARFGNSTSMAYLGTNVGGTNDDASADIMFQNNPVSTSGSEAIDVTSLITAAGSYYLELGARVLDWDNNEGGNFEFDNVNLNVTCS